MPLLHLSSTNGLGRTTVLREFQRQTGAHWVDVREFIQTVSKTHSLGRFYWPDALV